jgi:hypothetical protein
MFSETKLPVVALVSLALLDALPHVVRILTDCIKAKKDIITHRTQRSKSKSFPCCCFTKICFFLNIILCVRMDDVYAAFFESDRIQRNQKVELANLERAIALNDNEHARLLYKLEHPLFVNLFNVLPEILIALCMEFWDFDACTACTCLFHKAIGCFGPRHWPLARSNNLKGAVFISDDAIKIVPEMFLCSEDHELLTFLLGAFSMGKHCISRDSHFPKLGTYLVLELRCDDKYGVLSLHSKFIGEEDIQHSEWIADVRLPKGVRPQNLRLSRPREVRHNDSGFQTWLVSSQKKPRIQSDL